MDVRIRTPGRRIANLMIKVSLTDRQLSSCEISSKSDRPFSQNRCVTSPQTHRPTHTHTHTHRHTGLQWWSKKKHSYTKAPAWGPGAKRKKLQLHDRNVTYPTKRRSLTPKFDEQPQSSDLFPFHSRWQGCQLFSSPFWTSVSRITNFRKQILESTPTKLEQGGSQGKGIGMNAGSGFLWWSPRMCQL